MKATFPARFLAHHELESVFIIIIIEATFHVQERREIEAALHDGDLWAVAATNALELGVDVGSLDVTLHLGFPGMLLAFPSYCSVALNSHCSVSSLTFLPPFLFRSCSCFSALAAYRLLSIVCRLSQTACVCHTKDVTLHLDLPIMLLPVVWWHSRTCVYNSSVSVWLL